MSDPSGKKKVIINMQPNVTVKMLSCQMNYNLEQSSSRIKPHFRQ